MKFMDLSGKVRTGKLTKDHSQSSDGRSVLVVQGEAHGTLDLLGWQIVKAMERGRQALQKAGYHLPVKED